MAGWIVSALVALLGTGVALYYRSKALQAGQIDSLVKANTQVLSDLNTLLAKLAADANKAATKDLEDAKKISTAADAAAFLGGSLRTDNGYPGVNPLGTVLFTHAISSPKP